MNEREQTDCLSLLFPDRKILRIGEIAAKLDCTEQHVHDLIEEGKLGWVDITGANNLSNRAARRVTVEQWEKFLKERVHSV